ncbi:hypothetical protein [Ruania rhizosphaerae]|uniref:hypothetical protein n=1 Tax=Ruania rhizosphaerae TaxID=1840413 RepID=UPI00135A8521|nr:hypothetical protein [Ruania rhizosphaerae]
MTVTGSPQLAGMRAAVLPDRLLRQWTDDEMANYLTGIAGAGLDTVITKLDAVDDRFAAQCREFGLAPVGAMPCFNAARPATADVDHLRPVDERGHEFEQMEWYNGLIPTDTAYADALAARCAELAASAPVDGVVLDFIRWPLHWELELRPGTSPRRSSFDRTTLTRFAEYLDEVGHAGHGIEPRNPTRSATIIDGGFLTRWTQFRCAVITDLTARLATAIHSRGQWAGAYLVPGDMAARVTVGQDTAALGKVLDVMLPMTYHAILHRTPSWPASVVADIRTTTTASLVPVLQVTSDSAYAGRADWGAPISTRALSAAVEAVASIGQGGFALFPGHALTQERRDAVRHTLTTDG